MVKKQALLKVPSTIQRKELRSLVQKLHCRKVLPFSIWMQFLKLACQLHLGLDAYLQRCRCKVQPWLFQEVALYGVSHTQCVAITGPGFAPGHPLVRISFFQT